MTENMGSNLAKSSSVEESSRMQSCHWVQVSGVSKDHSASIFRVKQSNKVTEYVASMLLQETHRKDQIFWKEK